MAICSIVGRQKDLILRQSGEKISVEAIEAKLTSVPAAERAVVFGGGDLPWLVAIVGIDPACDAATEALVRRAMDAVVKDHNRGARASARIDRTLVVRVPFAPENGLVTRNLKLERNAIRRRFEPDLLASKPATPEECAA